MYFNNLFSASEHSDNVKIQAGRLIGPFEKTHSTISVSPLGVIPKTVQGEYRMIHHQSFRFSGSVFPKSSVQYSMPQLLTQSRLSNV